MDRKQKAGRIVGEKISLTNTNDFTVRNPQQRTVVGNDNLDISSAPTDVRNVHFFVPPPQWWLRQGTQKVAGNLMRPVLSSPLELPPLDMTIRAVATFTHQRLS